MDQSHGAKPFRFATEFAVAPPGSTGDAHATALEVAALRAEIEALRADHAVALSKARSEGYMEALGQMRAEREQAVLAALDALHAEWEVFGEARDAMIEALRGEASALALSIGEALAAQALREAPGEAIDQAIGRVLSQIARGQEVTVSVHPDLAEDIEARIATRQAGDRRRLNLVVLRDDTLAPGDAHLRWEGGGLRLDAAERRRAVAEELAALGV
ncbi:MAG: flagellar assembly protein FliH [Sphingobium sp.]|jgi:flagellar assembly protein FliH|nr:flagellar assembly protein FliH [Sphingobium sp.]MCI1271521.1 flagellar assembly protein FliH [Sphingobium sp.]MCI1756837.1 flagellar assembly protein FliH [Sphingobium sp.]MCI2052418.1 flagellar assembly protein FliH [Sphingobium sp.]